MINQLLCIVILIWFIMCESNIHQTKNIKYITSSWETETKGQEYTLQHGDWVFFWKSDEKPLKVGMVYVLWGYYRVIAYENKLIEFRDVEWCNANL